MEFPDDLKYTKDHEWIRIEGNGVATIGISAYAVDQLGDIVHVDLPAEGDEFGDGEPFGTVESTKTVSDLYMPLAGEVKEVNPAAVDTPETLQDDPYTEGWLVRVKLTASANTDEFMSSEAYQEFIQE